MYKELSIIEINNIHSLLSMELETMNDIQLHTLVNGKYRHEIILVEKRIEALEIQLKRKGLI